MKTGEGVNHDSTEEGIVMSNQKSSRCAWAAASYAAVVLLLLGFATSNVAANDQGPQPIVGLWLITASYGTTVLDNVFTGWTSDGLEFDQDTGSPILTGYVCYGHWIKLKDHTYGLTHPFFNYDPVTGIWNGTSGYFNYTVTVSEDGKTFTGTENGKGPVTGPNPYTGAGGTPFSGVTLSATKIDVDRSQLP